MISWRAQTGWVAAGQMFEKAGNIDLNEAIETLADLQAGFGVRVRARLCQDFRLPMQLLVPATMLAAGSR